jgi:hypothetical protein
MRLAFLRSPTAKVYVKAGCEKPVDQYLLSRVVSTRVVKIPDYDGVPPEILANLRSIEEDPSRPRHIINNVVASLGIGSMSHLVIRI